MEIIVILVGILILAAFIFFLIEYPYYLVSLFVFLHLYSFNIEIPGPLDLRGLLSVVIFLRLVILDKNNIDLIRKSISNKLFILIIVFSLYSVVVDLINNVSLLIIIKLLVLNIVALLLGFLTIINGHGKKIIALAILISGIFATGDLIFSYFYRGALLVYKIIDVIIGKPAAYNHNFFGGLCGIALVTTFLLFITDNARKKTSYILFMVFMLGIIISTSRMTFLTTSTTLFFIIITQYKSKLNLNKVLISGLAGIILIIMVALSYKFVLTTANIKSDFADQIYWRLVEEPLSFFNEDIQEFGWDNNKVQGSIRWRIEKTLRDANVFFQQNASVVFLGFGTGGYKNIMGIEYVGTLAVRYTAHNFYTNFLSEKGIVGLILFFLFFILLMHNAIKMIKNGLIQFSFVYILFLMIFYTFGGDSNLTDKFGFILYGCVIADIIQNKKSDFKQLKNTD